MNARKSGLPGELVIVDYLLERWARWARTQLTFLGWPPTSLTAKMIEWHELGLEPEKLYPAQGRDKAPEGVMFIDSCVAKLPPGLRRVLYAEYFHGGTNETKARALHINVMSFRQALRGALWVIYGKIEQ